MIREILIRFKGQREQTNKKSQRGSQNLEQEPKEEFPFLEMDKVQLGKALYNPTSVGPALSICLDQMTPRGPFHAKLFYNVLQIDINCCLAAKVNS